MVLEEGGCDAKLTEANDQELEEVKLLIDPLERLQIQNGTLYMDVGRGPTVGPTGSECFQLVY